MPKNQPTMHEFSNFYQQSCRNKRQTGNNGALQQGQRDAKAWLACFVSRQRPQWCTARTVANLSCAMRNTRFTIRRDREVLIDLLGLIGEVAEGFNEQNIANSLLALNQMGVCWGDLPRVLGEKLWAAVASNAEGFNEQNIANTLLALAQMGVRWGDLSMVLREKLWAAVERNAEGFNAQNIANTLLALDQMGVRWDDLPKALDEKLWAAVASNAKDFNEQNIANTLLALDQMGVRWGDLPRGLDEKLWAAVDRNAEGFNPQNIANTLLALNQMGVRWGDLPRVLGEKLWAAVERNAEGFNEQAIANSLLALDQMGVCWDDLPKALGEKLWAAVDRNAQGFNPQEIANTLLALDQMGVRWDALPGVLGEKLWAAVASNANDFNEQNIANTLLALDQMGVRWGDLSEDLGEKLWAAVASNAKNFNEQNIANTLLAYVRMHDGTPQQGGDKELYQKVLRQLITSAQSMVQQGVFANEEKHQIAQALTWLQAFQGEDYSEGFQSIRLPKDATTSRLQKSVVVALRALEPQMAIEEEKGLGFAGCMVVDIFIPENNLVIEVDGPHHYDKAGRLDQAARQKQQLLEKMGFMVQRIVYEHWDNLDQEGKESLLKQCLVRTLATEDRALSVGDGHVPEPVRQATDSTLPGTTSELRATAPVFMPKTEKDNFGGDLEPRSVADGVKWLEEAGSTGGGLNSGASIQDREAREKKSPNAKSSVISAHHKGLPQKAQEPKNCWQRPSTVGLFACDEVKGREEEVVESAASTQRAHGVEGVSQEATWQTVAKKWKSKHREQKLSTGRAGNSIQNRLRH